jgi:heat shock protein HslJ
MNQQFARLAGLSRLIRAGLLASALATGACSSPESPTIGTISVAGLAGPWRLELLQPASQGAILAPSSATYTLAFSGSSISAHADCNTCIGSFSLVGDSLAVSSELACTRAACPTQAFEALYTRILAGESRVGVSGGTLVLSSPRGLLRFTR